LHSGVPNLCGEQVLQVAGGGYHSLLLLEDGSVLAFGWNDGGQARVPDLCGRQVLQVAAGGRHSLLLLEDGPVLAFGRNDDGQAGAGLI